MQYAFNLYKTYSMQLLINDHCLRPQCNQSQTVHKFVIEYKKVTIDQFSTTS